MLALRHEIETFKIQIRKTKNKYKNIKLTAYFLLAVSITWAEVTSAVNVGFLVGEVFSTVKTGST